jgi:hypothetical protein
MDRQDLEDLEDLEGLRSDQQDLLDQQDQELHFHLNDLFSHYPCLMRLLLHLLLQDLRQLKTKGSLWLFFAFFFSDLHPPHYHHRCKLSHFLVV